MIEIFENVLQLTVTGVCSAICFLQAYRMKEKEWDILALFYAAIFLGDLYWLLFLLFKGTTPNLSYVSEFAWYAAYMFLLILLRFVGGEKVTQVRHPLLWIIPIFVIGMCIFYMQWGDYLANIISALLMGFLFLNSIRGMIANGEAGVAGPSFRRNFCAAVLIMCLIEYTLWTVSCFSSGEGIENPYYWVDMLFTMSMAAILPLFAKVVRA